MVEKRVCPVCENPECDCAPANCDCPLEKE